MKKKKFDLTKKDELEKYIKILIKRYREYDGLITSCTLQSFDYNKEKGVTFGICEVILDEDADKKTGSDYFHFRIFVNLSAIQDYIKDHGVSKTSIRKIVRLVIYHEYQHMLQYSYMYIRYGFKLTEKVLKESKLLHNFMEEDAAEAEGRRGWSNSFCGAIDKIFEPYLSFEYVDFIEGK